MKPLKDWTIEDAEQAYEEGFDVICNDGKISMINDELIGGERYENFKRTIRNIMV